jgi:hypothetical protein
MRCGHDRYGLSFHGIHRLMSDTDRAWAGKEDRLIPLFWVALTIGDESVPIDLNVLMQMVYELAALDLAIDYGQQPTPGLSQDDFDWVQKTIAG